VLDLLPGNVPALAPDLLGFGSAFHGPVALEDVTAEAHARRLRLRGRRQARSVDWSMT
jgi:hypothetical protein